MTFTNPQGLEATRHPYSIVIPRRGEDAVIGFMAMLRNEGVKCFIAGGFARWVLSPNETTPCASDIDIYFQDDEAYRLARFLLTERQGFVIALETNNALTLTPPDIAEFAIGINLQLIKPHLNRCGSVFDVLDAFDLNICQAALVITPENTLKGYVSKSFLWGETDQKLHIVNVASPLATLQRCMKYAAMGYRASNRTLIKIFMKWDTVPSEERQRIHNLIDSESYKELYDFLSR